MAFPRFHKAFNSLGTSYSFKRCIDARSSDTLWCAGPFLFDVPFYSPARATVRSAKKVLQGQQRGPISLKRIGHPDPYKGCWLLRVLAEGRWVFRESWVRYLCWWFQSLSEGSFPILNSRASTDYKCYEFREIFFYRVKICLDALYLLSWGLLFWGSTSRSLF